MKSDAERPARRRGPDGPRFGIVQGRLTQSPPGRVQWFPQDEWQAEFSLAAECGIDYVELIAERHHNPSNPLWTDDGIERVKALVEQHGLYLHALCNDYVIDHALRGSRESLEQCLGLLERGRLLGIRKYVLPLFEHSELRAHNAGDFVAELREIADRAGQYGILLCLETVLTGGDLIRLVERIDRSGVATVFDTGNRAALGHDLPAEIRLLAGHIRHVHIKDKNSSDQNVLLGTGLVNFRGVFEALADIGYDGPYTFETQRGKNPVRTARFNIEFVKFFYAEASER